MPADPLQTHVSLQLKHDAPLIACRFDPTGRYVFVGSQDNNVIRWELANSTKTVLAAHDSWVRSFAFTKAGDVMVTGGYDGRLIWWSTTAEQPTPIKTIDAHVGWVRALAVSPDGQFLASCGNDQKVRLWNLADGAPIRDCLGHARNVYNVAFHPDGQQLVSGDLVAEFIHWNVSTGEKVRQFKIESLSKYDGGFLADYGGPHAMTFNTDGTRLLASGITNVSNAFAGVGNPIVSEIDWTEGKEAIAHLTKANMNGVAWGLVWHPEGYVIGGLGAHAGGKLGFWKTDAKEEFHLFDIGSSLRDLALHPDGLRLATPHHDGVCRISLMAPKPA
ncbi:hypothetical protein GC163_05950 [bacterium]|nr:hypothetical protein [bacterium]